MCNLGVVGTTVRMVPATQWQSHSCVRQEGSFDHGSTYFLARRPRDCSAAAVRAATARAIPLKRARALVYEASGAVARGSAYWKWPIRWNGLRWNRGRTDCA